MISDSNEKKERREIMQRKLSTIILSVLLIITTAIPTMADELKFIKTSNGDIYENSGTYKKPYLEPLRSICINKFYIDKPIHKVTSNNTKVVSFSKTKDPYTDRLNINGPGKALIKADNEALTYVNVTNYKNACKSFKIGNKEYAKKFKNKPIIGLGIKRNKKLTGKVNVKPAKGWELINLGLTSNSKIDTMFYSDTFKIIKNKSNITLNGWNDRNYFNAKNFMLSATFRNKKTKEYSYAVIFSGHPFKAYNSYI